MDSFSSHSAQTLTECLAQTASVAPASGITIYTRHGDRDFSSYEDLLARSRRLAIGLIESGCGHGERVGLFLPTSVEFFVAFFGCLFAGAVPVTLPVPARSSRLAPGQVARMRTIVADAGLQLLIHGNRLISTESFQNSISLEFDRLARPETGFDRPLPTITPQTTALVQFTSGSITQPKGVVLSHQNIVTNVHLIGRAVRMGPTDTVNLWLPLFHDMGLIGSITAITNQAMLRLCSPAVFLGDPLGWLKAFSESHSTINAAPHFCFRSLIEAYQPEVMAGLDLSDWRVAFNGAETVHAEDIDSFLRLYSPCGFRASTMYPVYGLAETTLAATLPVYGSIPRAACGSEIMGEGCLPHWKARKFVSVGQALDGHEIQIRPSAPNARLRSGLPQRSGKL